MIKAPNTCFSQNSVYVFWNSCKTIFQTHPKSCASKPKLDLEMLACVCAREHNRNSCKVTRKPWKRTNGKERSPISDMINRVVKNMSAPVTVLHVTPMGAYRSDGHVGTWSDKPSVPDCSHWCLPGVPDMWNEILFSYFLLQKDGAN